MYLKNRDHFDDTGRDIRVWLPIIEDVWDRHKLERTSQSRLAISMFSAGECPAFRVEQLFVLKFYPPWARPSTYSVERTVLELLSKTEKSDFVGAHAPKLVAASFVQRPGTESSGLIFMDENRGSVWKWPYIVTTAIGSMADSGFVLGSGIASLWPDDLAQFPPKGPSPDGTCEAAAFLGRWMRLFHDSMLATRPVVVEKALKLNELSEVPCKLWDVWTGFTSFLMKQRGNLDATHDYINVLPPKLRSELQSFVPRNVRKLIRRSGHEPDPVFLHGDLNDDHLLLTKQNEKWAPAGVIDFGDGMVGDRHYDFVAMYALSSREPRLFSNTPNRQNYVAAAPGHPAILYPNRMDDFTQVCMCYTLMHRQDAIRSAVQFNPTLLQANSLKELAINLWNVNEE